MTTEILVPRTTTIFGNEYGGAAPMYEYILVIFLWSVFALEQPHFDIHVISIMSAFLNDSCHEGAFQDKKKAEKKQRHQQTGRSAPGPAHQE